MKKTGQLIIVLSLSLLTVGCERSNDRSRDQGTPLSQQETQTEENRDERPLTSGDQSEVSSDLIITQKIRRSMMDSDSLSLIAKNVQVITRNGEVTLRGSVNDSVESDEILDIANGVNGVKNVNNQIEVLQTD
jgi:hyperosmotically inducible protein